MTIQWFRDLVIIILGIIAVGAFIFWIVLSSLLYKRLNRILHSVERTTAAIQAMTSFITEEV
ncbi:MAG: hypothetical protein PHU08_03355, partial [Dehalococcoidales bacterium]|nr:hypothetical protein [Dehalococcoidales bacterium]